MLTSFMPLVKNQDFYSEVSKFRRWNERWHLTMVTYHSWEYSRKCKRHRKYIGTIHMVQNTKALSYRSTVMFYITQHAYWLQNIFYNWIAFIFNANYKNKWCKRVQLYSNVLWIKILWMPLSIILGHAYLLAPVTFPWSV